MVAKTALKLLIVFVEYSEKNGEILRAAAIGVDEEDGIKYLCIYLVISILIISIL